MGYKHFGSLPTYKKDRIPTFNADFYKRDRLPMFIREVDYGTFQTWYIRIMNHFHNSDATALDVSNTNIKLFDGLADKHRQFIT